MFWLRFGCSNIAYIDRLDSCCAQKANKPKMSLHAHHDVTWREPVKAGLISKEWVEEMRRELLPAEFR